MPAVVNLTICDDGLLDSKGECVFPGVRVKGQPESTPHVPSRTRTFVDDGARVLEAVNVVPGTVVTDLITAGATLTAIFVSSTAAGQPRLNLRFEWAGDEPVQGVEENPARDRAVQIYLGAVVGTVSAYDNGSARPHTVNFRGISPKASAKLGAYLRFGGGEGDELAFDPWLADGDGVDIALAESEQAQAYIALAERRCLEVLRGEASKLATKGADADAIRVALSTMAGERLFVLLGEAADAKIAALLAEVNVDKFVDRAVARATPRPPRNPSPEPPVGETLVPPPPGSPVADPVS